MSDCTPHSCLLLRSRLRTRLGLKSGFSPRLIARAPQQRGWIVRSGGEPKSFATGLEIAAAASDRLTTADVSGHKFSSYVEIAVPAQIHLMQPPLRFA